MGMQSCRIAGAAGYTCLVLIGLTLALAPPAGAQHKFSDWSGPDNLGPIINSASTDQGPTISKDELEIIFVSTRPGGFGGADLWVSTRKSKQDPFGPATNLGPIINTSGNDATPTLSRDGFLLYFASTRHGGFGGNDIWVSARIDRRDPLGWQEPVNLGPAINTDGAELGPQPFEDPSSETLTLIFYAIRPGTGARDLFTSTLDENGSFTPAVPIVELNTAFEDEQPTIRRDGLELLFASNRPGSISPSATDIWVSTRKSTSDLWGPPVNLGAHINTPAVDAKPALSFRATSLYFFSGGLGGSGLTDLFVSTRVRLKDDDRDHDDDDEDGGDDDG